MAVESSVWAFCVNIIKSDKEERKGTLFINGKASMLDVL